jgi:nitroreductase
MLASAAVARAPASTLAQEVKSRELPPARTAGGMPLMDAVKLRRSTREYADRPLTDQVLSDLLWAAFGINRPDGGRTAPYSLHIIAIDVYAAMADGVWLYEPKAHKLLPVIKDDIRAQTGVQDFVGGAPLNLIYVGHRERMPDLGDDEARLTISVDAGFIGQNVYLFCASEGLATVFRGSLDADKLGRTLQLAGQEFVAFAQTVGYPRA